MAEYKPNSHKSKEEAAQKEERKAKKVVTAKPKTKRNNTRKLMDIFIAEDAENVKSYVFMDVLVPAIKKAISDIVTDGIYMILYGESGDRKRKPATKVSYGSYYDDRRSGHRDPDRFDQPSGRFDYDDIIYPSRGEAERVKKEMIDMCERYGIVTVADMYDMSDLTAPYTSNGYGWSNVRKAEVVRTRDGYVIKLPKAIPIER